MLRQLIHMVMLLHVIKRPIVRTESKKADAKTAGAAAVAITVG
jgi:hypothetical protein